MTFLVPLDAFYASLVRLPDSYGLLWSIDGPVVYFRLGSCGQILIILPSYIDYLPWLLKLIDWVFLNGVGVPNQDVGLVAT